ncbi:hypothetical protein B0T11DRAFT_83029 [Plectosphaerella cucumerina]|uniref:NACHT domain-containing protein n=1 Tax=Plectosphaerella cucumerina TaxID=40658 RepID=A0A8K0X339_9PEZI|nr:hypothetical protein B0T11DRAFT_83029 [Plectosphaerella cucumerina]
MEAAGLASSIITFIDFSYKIVNGTVDVYKKSTIGTAADPHVSVIIKDLQDVTSDMMIKFAPVPAASAIHGQLPAVVQSKPHYRELQGLAAKCKELFDQLLDVLSGLERKADGNKVVRSFQAAWKTLRMSDQIAEIERKLDAYRVQLLLRLSLILADDNKSIQAQLDRIHQGNTNTFSETISQLRSVQDVIQRLEVGLQTQADHASTIDADQAFAMEDIREELSRIAKTLQNIHQQTPADLQILGRLRFDHVHTRFDAIIDGDFDSFTRLLDNDIDQSSRPDADKEQAREALGYWLESGDKVLHISGKAGSGKSTLMKLLSQNKIMVEKLGAWAGSKRLVVAKFFFWLSDRNPLQNSLEGLYRTILLEVLRQCPELTRIVFPEEWDKISALTAAHFGHPNPENSSFRLVELQDAMTKLINSFPGSSAYAFCFFIDGLDEYAGRSMDHLNLAKQLQSWVQSPNIRICASSRPYEEFHLVFDSSARIHLHELNGPDIRHFGQQMLEAENAPKALLSHAQIEELAFEVSINASGVFLWARLVLDSVCEGIRHQSNYAALEAKIEQAPEELTDLFLFLFNQINPADRTRAYQLLLLAASDLGQNANALLVSWIDDLEDPDFPYNTPRVAYTDEEVTRRISYAEAQLKLTCKGLLEVRHRALWTRDVYSRHLIYFLHRTVNDFLCQPETVSAVHQQLGENKLTSSDYLRLRLTEIKFARTSSDALMRSSRVMHSFLWNRFTTICRLARMTPRALSECGSLLEQFREEPYSISNSSGHTRLNDGTTNWGWIFSPYSILRGHQNPDISYTHFLIWIGASPDTIMRRISASEYDRSSSDLCLLLSVSWATQTESLLLLERLLENRIHFSNRLRLHPVRPSDGPLHLPGWVTFLVLLGNQCSGPKQAWAFEEEIARRYAALELHLLQRNGPDIDVVFEFHVCDTSGKTWREPEPGRTPVTMTLEDLILCDRPPNMDALLCEMKARKTWGRFANGIVGGLLRQFTALVDARAPDETTSANNAVEATSAASGGVDIVDLGKTLSAETTILSGR